MLQFIINLIAGAAGGNAAGALSKQFNLGSLWNSIVGIIGGGLGGQVLSSIMNSGKMDAGSIIGGIVSSGAGGAILTAIVGFVKGQLAKKS